RRGTLAPGGGEPRGERGAALAAGRQGHRACHRHLRRRAPRSARRRRGHPRSRRELRVRALLPVRLGAVIARWRRRTRSRDRALAAEWVTPDAVNFMLRWARGLVCMPCDGGWLDKLDIEPMVPPGRAGCDTAFTVSIDHRNAGSGIGAADRALTIKRFLAPE